MRRVYVWKYSRFGRNATYVGVHVAEMEAAGGQLLSATEDIDARTAAGKFARGMLWQVDEFVSNNIGEQWKEAHARRHRMGLPHNGQPRFGYTYHHPTTDRAVCPQGCARGECDPGYVPDPETAEAAPWTYEAYNGGMSVLKIAVAVNRRGFTTGTGKPWDQRSLRRYMDTGFCAGLLFVHDPACDCSQGWCSRKVHIPGAQDPLISRGTWEEYQRQRKARRNEPPRNESPVYPLAGLVACGRCGSPLWSHPMVYWRGPAGAKVREKYPGYLYQCSAYMRSRGCEGTWIARHRVESVVRAWLMSFASDIDRHAAAEKGREKVRRTASADQRRLQAEAKRIDAQVTELTLQLSRKVVDPADYRTAVAPLRERREQIGAELEALAAVVTRAAEPPVEITAGLAAEWDYLDARDRQLMLRKIVDRIHVDSAGKNGGRKGKASVRIASAWGEVYVLDA